MMNKIPRYVCFILLLSLGNSTLHAEDEINHNKGYVVDELLVGLHQDKDINSPITRIIATGTQLQVLERDGDYVKVRETIEGKIGWMDASYLMYDKPAKLQLSELKASIEENQPPEDQKNSSADEILESLQSEIESLKQQLSSKKIKNGELEANISKQEKTIANYEDNSNVHLIKELQAENVSLESQLRSAGNPAQTQIVEPTNLISQVKELNNITAIVAIAVSLSIGIVIGHLWEDYKIRRRHGGFRI